jgi:hypothetical protein
MRDSSDTWLIYNGASGSHDDRVLRDLLGALAGAGHAPARVIDCKDGTPDAAEADAAGIALIAIHGGDGTMSRTLRDLEGFSGQALALPGGTFNLLSRELFGERDPLAIVDLLAAGGLSPIRRTCIRGEGLLALAELLAGPGAKWADVREEMRDSNIGEVIAKGWDAAANSAVGPMVAVTRPNRGRDEGYAGVRLCPRPGGMTIDGYAAEGLGDYVQQGLAILKRDFREGPHDELGAAREVKCRSLAGQPIALMVDGERCEGASELAFSLDTFDCDLLGLGDGR